MTEKKVTKKAKSTKDVIKEVKTDSKKTKKKRMIQVNFNGTELLEGRVFDTTHAEEAKKAEAFDPERTYEPMTIILGEHEMLPKVEAVLEGMKEGETKKVKLSPSESFGDRQAHFVIVMPLKTFVEQKINPVPGLIIRGEINGTIQAGRVQSVSGGRVRVDFNHPLAGREVEYEVTIEKELNKKKDIAEALYNKYYARLPGSKKEMKGDDLCITISSEAMTNLKEVNPAITALGKELGVKISFKVADAQKGIGKTAKSTPQGEKAKTGKKAKK